MRTRHWLHVQLPPLLRQNHMHFQMRPMDASQTTLSTSGSSKLQTMLLLVKRDGAAHINGIAAIAAS